MKQLFFLIFLLTTLIGCKAHREGYNKAISKCKTINTPVRNNDGKLYYSIEFNEPSYGFKKHIYDRIKKYLKGGFGITQFILDDEISNEMLIYSHRVGGSSRINGKKVLIYYQAKCIIKEDYLKVEISDLYITDYIPEIEQEINQEISNNKITIESAFQDKNIDCEIIRMFDNWVEIVFNQYRFRFGS